MLILLTAIIFYFIGRYSKEETDIIETVKRKLKPKIKPGVIPFKTSDELEYEKKHKETDKEWDASMRKMQKEKSPDT